MSKEQVNLELFDFEPIKGYPMLNWKGKRPFRSTQYFPAQLKEVYGKEDQSGWINKIFWGDNLQVMSHLLKEFRGKVDLIYIDPPFDSKADYKKKISLKKKSLENDVSAFEEKQYTDMWSNDDYLQFIYERIVLCRELLSSTGSFFLHCDWNQGHYLKIICDEVFGADNFKNHIVWKRSTPRGNASKRHPEITDFILFYTKSGVSTWNPQYMDYSKEYTDKYYNQVDENNGRRFQPTSLLGHEGVNPVREWRGISKPWRYPLHRLDELDAEGQIYWPKNNGIPRYKRYLDEQKGIPVQSLWDDIPAVNSQAHSDTGYPTQKPENLLKRIIETSTSEGDLIFDCFMGSGTTQLVAHDAKRRFIGADINLGALQTTTKRLSLHNANFEVYNVNNYEIFRNPAEAKDLLIESLEIQKLDSNTAYDGEKDGYKVKIMPVNRIATKADLDDLIANLPYKQFEARKEAEPNKAVEEIMLVCMGHEPSLAADLENDVLTNGYKIKVKVVDILRDKSDLTFKYDSEASIRTENGKLVVDAFYPRNLLQKLSQQKDDVTEWREMVESIMIDWNYDGAVMEPALIDIPAKNDFVSGEYEIPKGASNIKVKITDLLSESYEEVIVYG